VTADSRAGTREVERAREGVGIETNERVGSRARSSARDGVAVEGGGDRLSSVDRGNRAVVDRGRGAVASRAVDERSGADAIRVFGADRRWET